MLMHELPSGSYLNRRAGEEEEIRHRSSACSQWPPWRRKRRWRRRRRRRRFDVGRVVVLNDPLALLYSWMPSSNMSRL
jgi:hypothetical protein